MTQVRAGYELGHSQRLSYLILAGLKYQNSSLQLCLASFWLQWWALLLPEQ